MCHRHSCLGNRRARSRWKARGASRASPEPVTHTFSHMSFEDILNLTRRWLRGLDLEVEVAGEADDGRPVLVVRPPLPSPPGGVSPDGDAEAPARDGDAEAPAPDGDALTNPTDFRFVDLPWDIRRRHRSLHMRERNEASPEDRILRAWQFGVAAAEMLRGARYFDLSLPVVNLPPTTVYVVLRAKREWQLQHPVHVVNREDYHLLVADHFYYVIGTVSHSFPSETEAEVYCAAAGFGPHLPPRWQPPAITRTT